jgi:diacylglycerol O-acyltransferase / wax synthase
MQQLSGQDAMFVHAELEGMPQHIGGVSIFDQSTAPGGKVRFKDILALLQSRVHLSPIFRRKLVNVPLGLGQPYWVDDPHFDIEYHVRHIALPKPGDRRQLCILAARIHSRPLARDKPLWEMYIIEGLDNVHGLPKHCFGMLLKVHHAAMDGATGSRFMSLMLDPTPVPAQVEPAPPWAPEVPSAANMLGKAYLDAWKMPAQAVGLLRQAVPTLGRLYRGYREHAFEPRQSPPRTRFQGTISANRVVDAVRFDFEQVRAMRQLAPGATINDVMLAIVSGGLRKFLEENGELPAASLVTGCPIDVRSPEEQMTGGNMVGFMGVPLSTQIEDPVARLRAVREHSVQAKAYAAALGPRLALELTDLIPGNVLALGLRLAAATGLTESSVTFNTIVTNVPGPPIQQYFCGARLVDALSLGPLLPNIGLFHVVYSAVQNKQGSVTLSFTACREMLPEPARYARCLQASFDEMALLVTAPAPALEKTPRKVPRKAPRNAAPKAARKASRRAS